MKNGVWTMKNPEWHQGTPELQLTVLRMSIEGHESNFEDGIIEKETFLHHFKRFMDQLEQLTPYLLKQKNWYPSDDDTCEKCGELLGTYFRKAVNPDKSQYSTLAGDRLDQFYGCSDCDS